MKTKEFTLVTEQARSMIRIHMNKSAYVTMDKEKTTFE